MNNVNLIGRMAADPELRYSQGGTAYLHFCIAVDGRKRKDVSFIDCTAFNRTAENIAQFFIKGERIGISGELRVSKYTKQDGSKGKETRVIVNNFDFLNPKREAFSQEEKQAWEEIGTPVEDDPLPF